MNECIKNKFMFFKFSIVFITWRCSGMRPKFFLESYARVPQLVNVCPRHSIVVFEAKAYFEQAE